MPMTTRHINPQWIADALQAYADRNDLDFDARSLAIVHGDATLPLVLPDGKFGLRFTAAIGKRRKAVTVDGKRTVIGWGDTEADAWAMAKAHPRWGGHPYIWTINEATFDKIAAGDFDATSWGAR